MALDIFQLSPTVVNTDKLTQAVANLMAKEKAESVAKQKAMTEQLAKIDSSKLRSGDVSEFNQLYNDFLTYGAQNANKTNDIAVQTEMTRRLNSLRGFVDSSARQKETEDVPLIRIQFDSDTDPESYQYITQRLNTPTSKLQPLDMTKIKKIDKKDYVTEFFSGMGGVSIEKNGTTYKNTSEVFTEIGKKAADYMAASSSSDGYQKAFKQYVKLKNKDIADKGIDLSTKEGVQEVVDMMTNDLARYTLASKESSVTKEKAPAMSAADRDYLAGFKFKNASSYRERLANIERLFAGDKTAADEVLLFLPAGSKISNNINSGLLELSYPESVKNPDQTVTIVTRKLTFDKKDPLSFVRGVNSLYSKLGSSRGWDNIDNEEVVSFAKATKWQPPSLQVGTPKRTAPLTNFAPNNSGDKTSLNRSTKTSAADIKKAQAAAKKAQAAAKKVEAVVNNNNFFK